jgi:predicted ribosomally synthesized peptide with SipW-like signal peptide
VRRKTAWALGGVLAGTVMLGATGTFATFSDTESLPATVGAGSIGLLSPSPALPSPLQVKQSVSLPVHPVIEGGGTATLRLLADGPCEVQLDVEVELPESPVTASGGLCEVLAGPGLDLLTVDASTAPFELGLSVAAQEEAGTSAVQWNGSLRLVLVQSDGEGGFSDEQLVRVHLLDPNSQGKGSSGNGNGASKDELTVDTAPVSP